MKIYCENCKYCYWDDFSSYGGDFCCKAKGPVYGYNFYRKYEIEIKCEDRNKDNECSWYKKRWYKIGVK